MRAAVLVSIVIERKCVRAASCGLPKNVLRSGFSRFFYVVLHKTEALSRKTQGSVSEWEKLEQNKCEMARHPPRGTLQPPLETQKSGRDFDQSVISA